MSRLGKTAANSPEAVRQRARYPWRQSFSMLLKNTLVSTTPNTARGDAKRLASRTGFVLAFRHVAHAMPADSVPADVSYWAPHGNTKDSVPRAAASYHPPALGVPRPRGDAKGHCPGFTGRRAP